MLFRKMFSAWRRLSRLKLSFVRMLGLDNESIYANLFEVSREDAAAMIRGERDLGTFFWGYVGYSEDTWPIVVLGDFKRGRSELGQHYYDLDCYFKRVVIDFDQKWIRNESADWGLGYRLNGLRICIRELRVKAVIGAEGFTDYLYIRTVPQKGHDMGIYIRDSVRLTRLIAARINYLWEHGRPPTDRVLPDRGQNRRGCWKNPTPDLIESLRVNKDK